MISIGIPSGAKKSSHLVKCLMYGGSTVIEIWHPTADSADDFSDLMIRIC